MGAVCDCPLVPAYSLNLFFFPTGSHRTFPLEITEKQCYFILFKFWEIDALFVHNIGYFRCPFYSGPLFAFVYSTFGFFPCFVDSAAVCMAYHEPLVLHRRKAGCRKEGNLTRNVF